MSNVKTIPFRCRVEKIYIHAPFNYWRVTSRIQNRTECYTYI